MTTDFLEFAGSLNNLEKTRNFNVFTGYSLEPFSDLLDRFGWRNRRRPRLRISVVGTNGKGSVSHFIAQSFCKLGFRTGLYTSPHLLDPRERIRVSPDLRPISDSLLKKISEEIFSRCDPKDLAQLSWFEWFTLGALVAFEQNDLEIQIFEAGLGGRLDATKLAEPDLVVLCAIGKDHTSILGDTKEKILLEKIGIAGKNTRSMHSMDPGPELRKVLENSTRDKGIELKVYPALKSGENYLEYNRKLSEEIVKYCILEISKSLSLGSLVDARHKLQDLQNFDTRSEDQNLELEPDKFNSLLPPGRLEVLSKSPLVIFDPAHNPDAINITLQAIRSKYAEKKFSVLAGFLRDKDGEEMANLIQEFTDKTNAFFLKDGEFRLPKNEGIQSISIAEIESVINNPKNSEGKGIIALGSFRLYKYVLESVKNLSNH
ncbi:hypothetical protein CH373_03500 [Leptospira perolatii]|uniref:Dihydrofolate synthase/folylpolyglutamate synthase n=1 Tax=Leptospira perolatii TaxID=2023191 RepID=A0A2M9ZT44_9LEPT|nr:cyanophycin synthetase [Leptospira perolatii]PJZ68738.1 hypothetical protein CH360_14380 [Leptospira perolatii]PJZ75093.1 hypothetical protein CH373_03500 [Leptospira perolatii]